MKKHDFRDNQNLKKKLFRPLASYIGVVPATGAHWD